MFSLFSSLPSPFSADVLPSLFERFIGTMPLSDSSETCMRAVRPEPSPAGLLSACPAGVPEVSRFSCLKFLGVPGVYDYAGPSGMLALALPVRVAFRLAKGVSARIALFRSSIPRPPIPLFTLHCAPRDAQRKTRGRVDRYSFLVRLFHPLLQTGLSRRTGYSLIRLMDSLNSTAFHPTNLWTRPRSARPQKCPEPRYMGSPEGYVHQRPRRVCTARLQRAGGYNPNAASTSRMR